MAAGKYLAGVAIAMCTTFLSALGLALQKRAHKDIAKKKFIQGDQGKSPSVVREPKWIIGLVSMAAGALLSLAVFALVGQSVASAFASVTIVYNMILSYLFLHEKITRLDVGIAALMICGTVLAVVFGSQGVHSSFLTLDDFLAIWHRPAAIVGFVLFSVMILCLGSYIMWYDNVYNANGARNKTFAYRITMLLRCLTAGLFSGFVGLFSKAVVSVFSSSVSGSVGDNLGRWEVWVFLILLPSSLVFQVFFLNSALKRFDAKEAVPLYQSMVVICGVTFGWTIFAEAEGKSGGTIAGFICGILLIVVGILCLLLKRPTSTAKMSTVEVVAALVEQGVLKPQILRRSHSAPPSEAASRRAEYPRLCRKAACQGIESLKMRVPVFTTKGTIVQSVYAVLENCEEAVTPSFLLGKKSACKGTTTTNPRMPPSLEVHTVVPTCFRLQSARARDSKLRASFAVAEHAVFLSAEELQKASAESEVMPEIELAPFPFFGLPAGAQRPEDTEQRAMMTSLRRLMTPSPKSGPPLSYGAAAAVSEGTVHERRHTRGSLSRSAFFSHDGSMRAMRQPRVERAQSAPDEVTPAAQPETVESVSHSTDEPVHAPITSRPPIAATPSTFDDQRPQVDIAGNAPRLAAHPCGPSMLLIPLALIQTLAFDIDVVQTLVRARNFKALRAPDEPPKRHWHLRPIGPRRNEDRRSTTELGKHKAPWAVLSDAHTAESKAYVVHVHEVEMKSLPGGAISAAATTITGPASKEAEVA